MEPFNLKRAKSGAKLVTRDGREARIGIWDANGVYPLVGVTRTREGCDLLASWTAAGKSTGPRSESLNDLFMAPEELYICVSVDPVSTRPTKYDAGYAYPDREEAEGHLHPDMRLMKLVDVE